MIFDGEAIIESIVDGDPELPHELNAEGPGVNLDGAAPLWEGVANKPFAELGSTLKVVNGVLDVNTADAAERDNTQPITSAAVFAELGNIDALLAAL